MRGQGPIPRIILHNIQNHLISAKADIVEHKTEHFILHCARTVTYVDADLVKTVPVWTASTQISLINLLINLDCYLLDLVMAECNARLQNGHDILWPFSPPIYYPPYKRCPRWLNGIDSFESLLKRDLSSSQWRSWFLSSGSDHDLDQSTGGEAHLEIIIILVYLV